MNETDNMDLPADTGQVDDAGQTIGVGSPDNTGQTDDDDDPSLAYYTPPTEKPPDDLGQPNGTGQSSSKKKTSNMGQGLGMTENEILETAVIDVTALLKPTDTPEQVAREVTQKMEGRIGLINISRAKGDKIKKPKKLRPFQIAMLILAMFHIRRVPCAGPAASRKYDLLVIYMEHGSDAGTYVEDKEEFYRIARRFNPQITDREFEEVFNRLRTDAKRVTRTMDPDLIAVNNGVFNFKTKELLPFTPNLVFLTKSRVNYNPNAINVVIHNGEDGTDWDVESWIESLSDDPEIVELLWELLSAIIRPYVSWNKSIWFYSDVGNNGKGTFCVLLRNLCGEEVVATISVPLHIQPKVFRLRVRQFGNISHIAVGFFFSVLDQPVLQNRSDLAHSGPGDMLFIGAHEVVVQRPEKSLGFRQSRELTEIVVAARPVPAPGLFIQTAHNGILRHSPSDLPGPWQSS